VQEIESVISTLKRQKAFAGDMLINEYFIESMDILASHLVDIFNAILNSGYFPSNWSKGIIVPVFKKDNPNDVNNYRGITLVSCFSKIFTGILNKRLSTWAENNNIVSDAQFGFKKSSSTVDAIFVLNAVIQKILTEKGRLYCAFVDLKKAFDSVYLNGLWLKLFRMGVNAKMLRIIRDMYNKVKSCVKGCNSFSEFFDCAIGLKQGEVISPILFSLFLEDLELFMSDNCECGLTIDDMTFILLLFADDMVILGNSIEDLQNSLNKLSEYCTKWGLEVNAGKTKIMVFRKRGRLRLSEKWSYNGSPLEIVDNFNYLGTVFNYTGNFTYNQETLVGKGLKAMNMLMANVKKLNLKPKLQCQLFDAFVGSVLNYSCEVWGFGKSKVIERLHLKFCKRLLNVKTSTCNMGVYGELGRYPLFINRYVRIIKYWGKVISSENCLITTLYTNLKEKAEQGIQNWAYNIKSLLDNYGFSYIWQNPYSVNLKHFHKTFKQRVVDVFTQQWQNELDNSRSLLLYRSFKATFGFEEYINDIPAKLRIPLTKLRLSSHCLHIETGRYGQNRVDANLRHCLICNSQDIEDEYHFVMICEAYSDIRRKYIKQYYVRNPSVYKFTLLMKETKTSIAKKLCKFVSEAFDKRKSLLTH